MGKIGISDRLNANSKKNIIFAKDYRKVRLDPRTLIPSEHNKYSQDNIEELADNMLLVGQLQEIIVGRVDGQDRIIVGHRRTAAAVLNIERGHDEFKLVDCKIKEMSESLFMLTLHSANIFNRQLSDWELTNGVAEFKKYLEQAKEAGELVIEGKMRDYIASATGKSTGKINQINSINNNLCEEGKEAFKDGKINFSTAYETSRLPEEKQHEVIENGELLSKDVREMVKEEREKKEAEKKPGDDYEPAHPESITSLYRITTYAYRRFIKLMEKISRTDDEDDLLELYAAVIQVVFNDRVENEEIERLDVTDIIDTFGAIVEIIDISVNEKIRYLGTMLGGTMEEDQGSAFDEYDQENGYIEETTQEDVWRSYGDNLDTILQICIKSMRNSYKECLESDLSDLLDYVVFQVEYDREK